MSLRYYQADALRRVFGAIEKGQKSGLLVLPTGTGKRLLFLTAARLLGVPTLVLLHRDELIQQTVADAQELWPMASTGVIKAERSEWQGRDLVAASVPSLNAARLAKIPPGTFGLLISDEAHHICGALWTRVVEHFKPAFHLGLTATPERLDGKGLHQWFGKEPLYTYPIRSAITEGFLVPIVQFAVETAVSLDAVERSGKDLNQEQLASTVNTAERNQAIVEAYLRHAATRRAIAFAVDVQHAFDLALAFEDQGVRTAAVWGDMEAEDRKDTLARFAAGKLRILVNVNILTEGFDDADVDCILMARPTQSKLLYTQAVGRGLRLPKKNPAKHDCIAEGTPILTDCGLVPIELVTRRMKVWDGVDFVSHGGAVCRGEQEVISYAGITATPDHELWTQEGWKTIWQCRTEQIPVCVTGIGRKAVRETEGYHRRGSSLRKKQSGPPSCGMYLWASILEILQRSAERGWMQAVRESSQRSEVAGPTSRCCRTTLQKLWRSGIRAIRCARNRIQILQSDSDGRVGSAESWIASPYAVGSNQQPRPLRAWQPSLLHRVSQSEQYAETSLDAGDARIPCSASGDSLCRRYAHSPDRSWNDVGPDNREILYAFQQTKRRVWDILNAGPRHRFTAAGLLVSNCLILDITDNCRRYKLQNAFTLMGAKDIKDGRGKNVLAVIDEAEEEEARHQELLREDIKGPVIWRLESVCPWPVLPTLDGYEQRSAWQREPASEKQLKMLRNQGLELMHDLSKGEASYLIDQVMTLDQRYPAPATPNQERLLRYHGRFEEGMTKKEASRIIVEIKREEKQLEAHGNEG